MTPTILVISLSFSLAQVQESEVLEALGRSTAYMRSVATGGGYVGIWSLDGSQRFGEAEYERAGTEEIWVQPPGTPSVGECYLRAHRLTGNESYLEAARDVGRALCWGQRESGGWDHRVKVDHLTPEAKSAVRRKGHATFDDNITQGALSFLMELDRELEEPWLDESARLGLSFTLEAQYENGSWPQWFPLRGGYHDCATFNDNAINDCIRVMLRAADQYEDQACLESARQGGAYILASQLPAPQAGWAQQYDSDGRPARARAFEPVAVCSAVTSRNLRTLLQLAEATGETRFLAAFPAAADWLVRTRQSDGSWPRFLELETNRSLFADRDGSVHYVLEEISEERRLGYSWSGSYGIPAMLETARQLEQTDPETFLEQRRRRPAPRIARRSSLDARVREITAGLDEQGRWVRDGKVHCADFVQNSRTLLDWLEAGR